MTRFILSVITLSLLLHTTVFGQTATRSLGPYSMFEQIIYREKQEEILTYIAHDCTEGRETGTPGSLTVSKFICDCFQKYGLEPYQGKSFYQRFEVDSLTRGVNVAGMIRSRIPSDEYVILTAHYDHIGKLRGAVYNGADNNASGVTALLNLADMFGTMHKAKLGPNKNLVFVALDGKERNMAGSKHFVRTLNIDQKKIICSINIDQIGTVLEPVHERDTNFVIVLGEKYLDECHRGKIDMCNKFYKTGLDIDHTFYGSRSFTELYFKLSDQIVFHEAGIPALVFSSGFHKFTYKTNDDPELISYPVLKKRTILIFYLTMML